MNQAQALTKNSFKISGRGIVLELRHSENGLAKGTELVAEKSGRTWKVIARILFDHAVGEQKVFEVESVDFILLKYRSTEKRQQSLNEMKERESQNIYQYLVEPSGTS
ncbi:MAG: hypothetical protein WBA74_09915 [Cyclobacteriaceae bacterium]